MKLKKKLSLKQFILSLFLILTVSFIFLFGLYFVLNIQYQREQKPFSNGPVTTLPKSLRLDLDQPDDDTLSIESSIIISGKTGPNMDVLIYTDSKDLVVRSKSNGNFSTILNLDEGVNSITVAVFDVTGDSRFSERTIYYSKEKL